MNTPKKIKVMQVLGGLWCGGTETFVMNMYHSVDKEKVQFDFLVHEKSKAHYDDEVLSLGGQIHRISDRHEVGTIRYVINLVRLLRKLNPDIVHSHAMFNSGIVMLAAFLAGIKKRICHAHSAKDESGNKLSRRIYRLIMRMCIKAFSTNQIACSDVAAEFLFSNKHRSKRAVPIINGIDVDKHLSVAVHEVDVIRKQLGISEENYVIGFVGRLVAVKNPLFLIKVFEEIRKINNKAIMVIVGEGSLKIPIQQELKKRDLIGHVRLTGNRTDVPGIMCIFDVLVLPSLFEGLSIVTLEAQASGLPCILSDNVPTTADVGLGLIRYISIRDEEGWVKAAASKQQKVTDHNKIRTAFKYHGFDTASASNKLLKLYG
ncbi:hypothetical protein SD71_13895 [Cohnella kolymensis]|uniref:Uncharacterized protein n=1 Tax=Cohnella kolymensis TaxID=1590652 RepID=A0ABR5A4M4_9BACL|nr:glycosyltransferase [Cohnella kolymensis]KIL35397.1 hypothetical protein SD71_13895 [Cohnella kolymensis]